MPITRSNGVPAPGASAATATAQPGPPVASPADPVARLDEKVRSATMAGRVSFLPYLDPYTEETSAMRRMYPMMLRNPVVKQSLQHKVHSVASLDLLVVPAAETERDHEVADFVRYSLADALEGGFPALAEETLFPALIWKSVVAEKVWYPELWERGKFTGKRFYRAVKAKEQAEPLYDEFRNIVGVRATGYGQAETFDPGDFLILKNWPMFGGPGMSDLRAAYLYLWQLDTCEKLHLIHLEKFLSPIIAATYDETFNYTTDGPQLEKDLAAMRSRSWIKIPRSVQIAALQLAVRGEAEFLEKCKDLREQITLSITGAYLQMLTATSGGDIRGSSRVQQSTSELLVWELAARLAGVLNTQYVPSVTRENYGGVDYPKVVLGGISYKELLDAIQIDSRAQQMGAKLSARAIARKYSLQLAADASDELVPIKPPGPDQGGGGMPGGGAPGGGFSDPPDPDADDPEDPRSFCGGPGSGVPGPCPEGGEDYKPGSGAGTLYRPRKAEPALADRYAMRGQIAQRYHDLGQPKVMDDRAVAGMNDLDPGGGLASNAALARDILHADAYGHEEAITLFDHADNRATIAVAAANGHTEKLDLEPGKDGGTHISGIRGSTTIPANATHAEAARLIYRAAGIQPPREVRASLRRPANMADPPRVSRRRSRRQRLRHRRRRFALNLNALLLGTSSFDDGPADPPPGPAPHPIALGGADGARAEQLLSRAQQQGAAVLATLTRRAVVRLVRGAVSSGAMPGALFSDTEQRRLGHALAATLGTAHLLGAARIRRRAEQVQEHSDTARRFSDVATDLRCFDEAGGIAPMAPRAAVEYFRRLVPGLAVDAQPFAESIGRQAFALAVSTDQVLLGKVKGIIAERLETGQRVGAAAGEVDAILEQAGVAPANAGYSDMVVRTEMMNAFAEGSQRELTELADVFPAWMMSNPADSRSRPEHAARAGKLYPTSATFADVRGRDAGDVINCRCVQVAIDKFELRERLAAGEQLETEW